MTTGGKGGARERGAALLERDAELTEVDTSIAAARDGQGGAIAILGSPGIGKSRLLAELQERAVDAGVKVLAARGSELEREFAFGVVRQLFESELARVEAAARAEVLADAAGPAERVILGSADEAGEVAAGGRGSTFGALHALYWLTANLAEQRPLALTLDDAHWADPPSLRFIAYLAGRTPELPGLVALAARPGEPGVDAQLIDAVVAEDSCEVLWPKPLSAAGVGRILGEGAEPPFVDACHEVTGGNPLLVEELRSDLVADGVEPTAASVSRVAGLAAESVARSVLPRLARLPADAAELARCAAILGTDADVGEVARLADIEPDRARALVGQLEAASILAGNERINFAHPLVRTAVYDDLGPSRRGALHAHAARLLATRGAASEAVATHLLEAPPAADPEVVGVLRRAAADARARDAPELGARMLLRALAEPPTDELRGTVLAELGALEAAAGDAGALDHLSAALELPNPPEVVAEAALAFVRLLLIPGRAGDAFEACDRALATIPTTESERRLLLQVETLATARMDLDQADAVRERLAGIPADARRGRTPAERALCGFLSMHETVGGTIDAQETVELSERAYGGGRLVAEQDPASPIGMIAIHGFAIGDRFDLAVRAQSAYFDEAVRSGSAAAMQVATILSSLMYCRAGDLRRAEAEARVAWNDAGQLGDLPGVPTALAYLAEALVEMGRTEEAEEALALFPPAGDAPNIAASVYVLRARGLLFAARGEWERSRDEFLELGHRMEAAGDVNPVIAHWRTHAAIAHCAIGERKPGRALAEREVVLARTLGPGSALGVALRGLAHASDGEERIERLHEAERALSGSGARLEHARALVELGAALRRAGRRREAREPLGEGMRLARSCGAAPLAERAYDELRAAGARPRKIVRTGVEELTASERRVADMAAEGMTNKEIAQALFVTVRTVETHLRHTYQKLEISSRQELAQKLSD